MVDRIFTSGGYYEPEAIALFARMTSQPDARRKAIISEIIFQLKTNLIWNELDAIWFTAAHDSQAAKLNWKSTSYNLTELGTMNFIVDRGYTRNGIATGTSDALDTGFFPNTGGVKATLNSNSFGFYSATNIDQPTGDMGSLTSGNIGYQINAKNGNFFQVRNNSSTATNNSVTDSLGLFVVKRTASNSVLIYKRDILLNTVTTASSSVSPFSIYLCAANVNGAIAAGSTRQISFAFIGSGIIDITKLYTIIQTYMTVLGAAV